MRSKRDISCGAGHGEAPNTSLYNLPANEGYFVASRPRRDANTFREKLPVYFYDISPDPEPDEAAAIVQALSQLLAEERSDDPTASSWRAAAAREAVDDGLD